MLPGTVGPYAFHVVMWRAPANWTTADDWVRTQHVPRSENSWHPARPRGRLPWPGPPEGNGSDIFGAEFSIFSFNDGTVFMISGGCQYYVSEDHGHSFYANSTFKARYVAQNSRRAAPRTQRASAGEEVCSQLGMGGKVMITAVPLCLFCINNRE